MVGHLGKQAGMPRSMPEARLVGSGVSVSVHRNVINFLLQLSFSSEYFEYLDRPVEIVMIDQAGGSDLVSSN